MENCIFCKIVNNEIPSYKIYEDELCIAILDISQMTYGHTLVIPKAHYENIFDQDSELTGQLHKRVGDVAKLLKEKLNLDAINVLNNNGSIAGQEVMHYHVHLIPRSSNDDFKVVHQSHVYDFNEILMKIKS